MPCTQQHEVSSDTGYPTARDVLRMWVLIQDTQHPEKRHFGLIFLLGTSLAGCRKKSAAGKKATKRVPVLELQ